MTTPRRHPTLASKLAADAGWTVPRLAERLGLHRTTVGDWLRGREPVPRRRQAQIGIFLETGTSELFDENGVARPYPKETS